MGVRQHLQPITDMARSPIKSLAKITTSMIIMNKLFNLLPDAD